MESRVVSVVHCQSLITPKVVNFKVRKHISSDRDPFFSFLVLFFNTLGTLQVGFSNFSKFICVVVCVLGVAL